MCRLLVHVGLMFKRIDIISGSKLHGEAWKELEELEEDF